MLSALVVGLSPAALAGPGRVGTDYLTAADVLPGSCEPAIVLFGQVVDCRFPLARDGELDPWFGPHVADQDVVFDDENDDQADCVTRGRELICEGITAYYGLGDRTVRPIVSGVLADATATFDAEDWLDHGVNLTARDADEPYVFEGRTLGAWLDSAEVADMVYARITTRDGSHAVATIPLGPVRPNTYEPVEIDLDGIAPGRYRVTPCLGDTPEGCEALPGGQVLQVGTLDLLEVVPGWNLREADRINLVFAASGFASVDAALEVVRRLITWDGPMALGWDGEPVGSDASPELIAVIEFGPFAIEPLASNRHRFNLWMVNDLVADPRSLFHSAPPLGFGPAAPELGLSDVSVTSVHLNPIGRYGRSEAGWSSFTSPDGPSVVERDGLAFGGSYLAVPRDWALDEASTLAHEWGHALFDLRDEYIEGDRAVTHGYPNCAPDTETAAVWWGDLVGEIDPFVYVYVAALERYAIWVDPFTADRVAVGYEAGGCYSSEIDAIRPTADSLMNSGMPVFGSVNRRRVEEILSLWTGRLRLTDESELSVECDPIDPDRPATGCRATVAPMVDAAGLVLTLEGGTTSACAVESGGGDAPTLLVCRPLPLAGTGPWTVTIGTASGSVSVAAVIAGPPPTPTTTSVPTPAPGSGSPGMPVWLVLAAGAIVVALLVVTAIRRARR